MGIRQLEKSLAAELCYEAVVRAVEDYLDDCEAAGRILPAHENLIGPILRTGFSPPGLIGIQGFVYEEGRSNPQSHPQDAEVQPHLPDADRLIEKIMAPYPVSRLRKANQRSAR